jgi:hypothetical protein
MHRHLTKISSIARVLNGGLCILIPHQLLDTISFGNYAILFSTSLILGYLFELGIGLASMATPEEKRREQSSLVLLAFKRDVFIAVATGAAILTTRTNFAILAAASATASLITWQGILRANDRPLAEFNTNITILFGILSAAVVAKHNQSLSPQELIVIFLALPRALSLCICIPSIYRLIKLSQEDVERPYKTLVTARRCIPFWIQSLFAAATSNFDTLIAASLYGPQLAGSLKLVTTIINLGFSPFEVLYHYLLNEKANRRASSTIWIESSAFKLSYSLILASAIYLLSILPTNYIELNKGSMLLISSAIGITVFLRAHSIQLATTLSISGKQSSRVTVLVVATTVYWLLLWLSKFTSNEDSIYLSIVVSSLVQLALYHRAMNRHINDV